MGPPSPRVGPSPRGKDAGQRNLPSSARARPLPVRVWKPWVSTVTPEPGGEQRRVARPAARWRQSPTAKAVPREGGHRAHLRCAQGVAVLSPLGPAGRDRPPHSSPRPSRRAHRSARPRTPSPQLPTDPVSRCPRSRVAAALPWGASCPVTSRHTPAARLLPSRARWRAPLSPRGHPATELTCTPPTAIGPPSAPRAAGRQRRTEMSPGTAGTPGDTGTVSSS